MNEKLTVLNFTLTDPVDAAAVGANHFYTVVPTGLTIVYVSVAPAEDDAGATLDINDDGTGVITAVDASDKDVPGTWSSTHFGGANAPVVVAADSEISLDINNGAAENGFHISIWALIGEA